MRRSPHPSNVTNHSCYIEWNVEEVSETADRLLTQTSPFLDEDYLLLLIAKINLHVSEVTNTTVQYDALKIVSMPDRSSKLDLKNFQTSSDKQVPLAILHLGNERGLNMIARRFDPLMLDIFDIRLDNLSLLTIHTEANSNMYAKFSVETCIASHTKDFHVILLPYRTEANKPTRQEVMEFSIRQTSPSSKAACEDYTEVDDEGTSKDSHTAEMSLMDELSSKWNDPNSSDERPIAILSGTTQNLIAGKSHQPHTKEPVVATEAHTAKEETTIDMRPGNMENLAAGESHQLPVQKPVEEESPNGLSPGTKQSLMEKPAVTMGDGVICEQEVDEKAVAVDIESPNCSRLNSPTSKKIKDEVTTEPIHEIVPFLHHNAHIAVINSRKGGKIKTWLKSCGLTAKSSVVENRDLLIKYLDKKAIMSVSHLAEASVSIPKTLVRDIVQGLNDKGISSQLESEGLPLKESADKRKFQLLSLLYERFSSSPKKHQRSNLNISKILKYGGKDKRCKVLNSKRRVSSNPAENVPKEGVNHASKHTEKINAHVAVDVTDTSPPERNKESSVLKARDSPVLKTPVSIKLADVESTTAKESKAVLSSEQDYTTARKTRKKRRSTDKIAIDRDTGGMDSTETNTLCKEKRGKKQDQVRKNTAKSAPDASPGSIDKTDNNRKVKKVTNVAKVASSIVNNELSSTMRSTIDSMEVPLRTLEENVLALDQRLDRQEDLIGKLVAKIESLLAGDIDVRLRTLQENDKQLFRAIKNQEQSDHYGLDRLIEEKIATATQQPQTSNTKEKKMRIRLKKEMKNLQVSINEISSNMNSLKGSLADERAEFSTEVRSLGKKLDDVKLSMVFKNVPGKKLLSKQTAVIKADHSYMLRNEPADGNQPEERPHATSDDIDIDINNLTVAEYEEVIEPEFQTPETSSVTDTAIYETEDQFYDALYLSVKQGVIDTATGGAGSSSEVQLITQEEILNGKDQEAVQITEEESETQNIVREGLLQVISKKTPAQSISAIVTESVTNDQSTSRTRRGSNYSADRHRLHSWSPSIKRNALLVHDTIHDDFKRDHFSNTHDVSTVKYKSLEHALSRGNLIWKIKQLKPETVFIHLGYEDIRNNRSYDDIMNDYKQLTWRIIDETNAKVCISTVIPDLSSDTLKMRIREVNRGVNIFINDTRINKQQHDRLFSTGNDNLRHFVVRTVNKDGATIKLDENGQLKLWLRLRDSLDRISLLTDDTQNSRNRDYYG